MYSSSQSRETSKEPANLYCRHISASLRDNLWFIQQLYRSDLSYGYWEGAHNLAQLVIEQTSVTITSNFELPKLLAFEQFRLPNFTQRLDEPVVWIFRNVPTVPYMGIVSQSEIDKSAIVKFELWSHGRNANVLNTNFLP